MPITALPEHLRDNDSAPVGDGTDGDNKAQKRWPRKWTAYGPNADTNDRDWFTITGIPFTKYRIILPFKLPAKWRRFPILLVGYNVTRWFARNDEGGEIRVWALADRWKFFVRDLVWHGEDSSGEFRAVQIGPSPIQKGARISLVVTWPLGFSFTMRFKFRKKIRTIFIRFGSRWDSFDDYWVCPAVFAGGNYN